MSTWYYNLLVSTDWMPVILNFELILIASVVTWDVDQYMCYGGVILICMLINVCVNI